MNRRQFRASSNDASGQAGWMYSDLLLGLVVLFMATVSFVPDASLLPKNDSAFNYARHFDQVFQRTYTVEVVSAAQFKADIDYFLAASNLPAEAVIETMQVAGGYDPTSESPTAGIDRAVAFVNEIDRQDPTLLRYSSSIVDGTQYIAGNQIAVKMKFGITVR